MRSRTTTKCWEKSFEHLPSSPVRAEPALALESLDVGATAVIAKRTAEAEVITGQLEWSSQKRRDFKEGLVAHCPFGSRGRRLERELATFYDFGCRFRGSGVPQFPFRLRVNIAV